MADTQTRQADPLAGLIDIPLPQEVSLLPQTWPSRVAIVLIVGLAVWAIFRLVHRYRANRYRREALSELDRMRRMPDAPPDRLAAQLAVLVRRTALAVFPRETIVPLTGTAWLAFLDRSYGGDEFSRRRGTMARQRPLSTDRAGPR